VLELALESREGESVEIRRAGEKGRTRSHDTRGEKQGFSLEGNERTRERARQERRVAIEGRSREKTELVFDREAVGENKDSPRKKIGVCLAQTTGLRNKELGVETRRR